MLSILRKKFNKYISNYWQITDQQPSAKPPSSINGTYTIFIIGDDAISFPDRFYNYWEFFEKLNRDYLYIKSMNYVISFLFQ